MPLTSPLAVDEPARLEATLNDSWEACLRDGSDKQLQSPSLFRRLIFISGVRAKRAELAGRTEGGPVDLPETEESLERLHWDLFIQWLSFSLERQKADINIHLNLSRPRERGAI